MADQPPESVLSLPVSGPIQAGRASNASSLAEEVVTLFDQLRDRLLRYVISFGLQVQDGEDIVQEVFLSLYRHLQHGQSQHNLRAWIFRAAHNMALKRRVQLRVAGQHVGGDERAVLADLLPDPNPSPEDQMASSQRRDRMLAVVGALPEQDRQCLILRAEGLRYREIIEVLDISLGAVALSLERSLARLARAVQW